MRLSDIAKLVDLRALQGEIGVAFAIPIVSYRLRQQCAGQILTLECHSHRSLAYLYLG